MRKLVWAALAAALLVIAFGGLVYADRGGNSAVTIVPAGGKAGGVRLRAQTVDVTLVEDEQGVWADSRVWLQLSNPLTRGVTLTLSLPGPQLTPGDLPANLQLKLGDVSLPAQAATAPAKGLVAEAPLAPQEEAALQMTYRQALSDTNGLVTFAYPLTAAAQWGGAPESLRMTVSFATPPAPEQILGVAPEPQRANSQTLVWSWDSKAAPDVWVAFMTPSWWNKFTATRNAATAPGAKAAQHLALSQIYQQLAALPPLPFQPDLDFYARYYPSAIAELQAAATPQTGGAPAPEEITAHAALARLYRDQAGRLSGNGGNTYLELAAAEAQAALSLGSADGDLRSLASDAYLQLAADARSRGDVAGADGYLARLAALEPASRTSAAAQEQKAARLALAAEQVARGNLDTARQIVAESFGQDAVNIPALRPPLASQVLVNVETTVAGPADAGSSTSTSIWLAGRRRLLLTLADSRDPAALHAMIEQVREAWQPVSQASVTTGPDWLAVEFPFQDDRGLGEIQTRLARLLPGFPELALLSAALSPESLAVRASDEQFQQARRYAEAVDLGPAPDAWQQRAQEIRAASERLAASPANTPTPAPSPTPGQPGQAPAAGPSPTAASPAGIELGDIQRALWGANAQTWETLANHSYAQYSVKLSGDSAARQWQVPAGARRTLNAETADWRVERLAVVAAGGLLAVLLLAYLLWRWL